MVTRRAYLGYVHTAPGLCHYATESRKSGFAKIATAELRNSGIRRAQICKKKLKDNAQNVMRNKMKFFNSNDCC